MRQCVRAYVCERERKREIVLVCMKCANGELHTASVRDFHDMQALPYLHSAPSAYSIPHQ